MFDEAIRALQNHQPEQAIHLILMKLKEQKQLKEQQQKDFDLIHHEDKVISTTFLDTAQWESH